MGSHGPVKAGRPVKVWLSPDVADWLRQRAERDAARSGDRPSLSRVTEAAIRRLMRPKRAG